MTASAPLLAASASEHQQEGAVAVPLAAPKSDSEGVELELLCISGKWCKHSARYLFKHASESHWMPCCPEHAGQYKAIGCEVISLPTLTRSGQRAGAANVELCDGGTKKQ